MLLMCSLVFKLMKKRSTGPEKKDPTESEKEVHSDPKSLSHFKAREKKTQPSLNSLSYFRAHEKEVHPDPNSLSHFKAREKKTQPGS